jgi:hypothetical protein
LLLFSEYQPWQIADNWCNLVGIVELCTKIWHIMRNDFKDYARTFRKLCANYTTLFQLRITYFWTSKIKSAHVTENYYFANVNVNNYAKIIPLAWAWGRRFLVDWVEQWWSICAQWSNRLRIEIFCWLQWLWSTYSLVRPTLLFQQVAWLLVSKVLHIFAVMPVSETATGSSDQFIVNCFFAGGAAIETVGWWITHVGLPVAQAAERRRR